MPEPAVAPQRLPLPNLTDGAVRAYAYAVTVADLTPGRLADEMELSAGEAEQWVQELLELKLLRTVTGRTDTYTAVAPDTARYRLLSPALEEVRQRQEEIDRVHTDLARLSSHYEESMVERIRREAISTLSDLNDVRHTITDLAGRSEFEVLTAQPGGARREEVLQESLPRTEQLLRRGVQMRTLYQHSARFSSGMSAYVEHVTQLGAEVRTLASAFQRLIVFDRRFAVISLRSEPQGACLVKDLDLVAFIAETFESLWVSAAPFPTTLDRSRLSLTSAEIRSTVITMLVSGEEDKVIAKRLGISLRTCQRHVSEIMNELGARNRLHAGYLLHRLLPSEG
ncbi:helix-turn-helix transcriptional regulator [Streptomyces cinnabarinus]|uniref:Helix-turn-helix transcriptional regulator n=1 Tax=Streptomyces cinnabarinus TaxID=67287 RepID=A0ABY7KBE5_9ACTN|nr:helix-turn-helix transcriptional regulator [Streptomyces cinnabarinus]WAZ21825.1 helix-turn-helix transcriptional regulator [Streptomyces cinnabarinus]